MNTKTLKNPAVVYVPDPHGIDVAIYDLQARLAAIPWLEKSFGRAWTLPDPTVADKRRIVPMVYQGDGEYYVILSNDALRSYSFWRVRGRRGVEQWSPLNNRGVYQHLDTVDLIVWANLKAIDKTKDHIFKETLITDVMRRLDGSHMITVTGIFDDKVEDIFSGYTLEPAHRDLLKYPFTAFRIEASLQYRVQCDPNFLPTPAEPPPGASLPEENDVMIARGGQWIKISLQEFVNLVANTPITE